MAAGSPVSLSHMAAASATKQGPVKQGVAVADMTVTATTGTLPTADGAVTIANAATPTVAELQEFCVELEAKVGALLASLRTAGVLAN